MITTPTLSDEAGELQIPVEIDPTSSPLQNEIATTIVERRPCATGPANHDRRTPMVA